MCACSAQQGYRVGVTLVMLNFGITLSAMYLLPQYIQSGMMLPVAMAGMLMLPGGIVNCIVSVIAGGLYDRIGARIPARAGFALSIVGAVMFLLATPESPDGVRHLRARHHDDRRAALAMSPSQTSALNSLPHRMNADGSTMMNTLQQVLGAVATAVATSLLGMGQAASAEGGASRVHERRALGLRVHPGAGSCRVGGIDAVEEAQLRRRGRHARRRRCVGAWRGACKRPAGIGRNGGRGLLAGSADANWCDPYAVWGGRQFTDRPFSTAKQDGTPQAPSRSIAFEMPRNIQLAVPHKTTHCNWYSLRTV